MRAPLTLTVGYHYPRTSAEIVHCNVPFLNTANLSVILSAIFAIMNDIKWDFNMFLICFYTEMYACLYVWCLSAQFVNGIRLNIS